MSGRNEDNNDVYNNLTEAVDSKVVGNQKWTAYLILCCITVCSASFIFGFNIGATNLPTPLIKEFFARRYFADYYNKLNSTNFKTEEFNAKFKVFNDTKSMYDDLKAQLDEATKDNNQTAIDSINDIISKTSAKLNTVSVEEYINEAKKSLDQVESELRQERADLFADRSKLEEYNTFLWTVTTAIFVVGGMFGAFTSKYVADYLGRKKGIIFHLLFSVIGAVLVLIAPYVNSPVCVIVSRFVYGIQGGMSCGLIPTYLSEISPSTLRGATGVIHQLCLTIGILVAQTLGFRQLLGVESLWHFLLAIPIVPSILGAICLLLFFPESPRALLINKRDEDAAREALHRLRNTTNVSDEIEQMNQESRDSKSDEAISLGQLFTSPELRWPLLTGLILQLTQQLCGINAIFFYSEGIFRRASIQDDQIQYAVFATGLINVILTIICVPLIDRLGRKPLLVYPMFIIIFDFILLTIFLIFQSSGMIFSYLSIVCIVIFIMCFAIGLGPIPFLYVAECFRQDARSAALAICMFTNWVANLVLTLTFPYLAVLLTNYVFLVFTGIVGIALVVIIFKVPETKGRNVEEIIAHFNGTKPRYDESSGKLMPNTKV